MLAYWIIITSTRHSILLVNKINTDLSTMQPSSLFFPYSLWEKGDFKIMSSLIELSWAPLGYSESGKEVSSKFGFSKREFKDHHCTMDMGKYQQTPMAPLPSAWPALSNLCRESNSIKLYILNVQRSNLFTSLLRIFYVFHKIFSERVQ